VAAGKVVGGHEPDGFRAPTTGQDDDVILESVAEVLPNVRGGHPVYPLVGKLLRQGTCGVARSSLPRLSI
jgi:hypothetical protein